MKKNRIYFGLLILALVVTIVWTSAGMLGVNKEEKKRKFDNDVRFGGEL